MKRDNKKALYESIMTSVAKEVKKALNEKWNDSPDEFEYETNKIYEYFNNICKNCEIIPNEKLGTIAIYFPDRNTLVTLKKHFYDDGNSISYEEFQRISRLMNSKGIAHISISKPPRLNGGFGVSVYKGGNYDKNEYPNPRRAFKNNGQPRYENLDELFDLLDEHIFNGDWTERLNMELK